MGRVGQVGAMQGQIERTTENVRAEHVAAVQAQIATYHQLRHLVDEWVDAATELDRLRRRTQPR